MWVVVCPHKPRKGHLAKVWLQVQGFLEAAGGLWPCTTVQTSCPGQRYRVAFQGAPGALSRNKSELLPSPKQRCLWQTQNRQTELRVGHSQVRLVILLACRSHANKPYSKGSLNRIINKICSLKNYAKQTETIFFSRSSFCNVTNGLRRNRNCPNLHLIELGWFSFIYFIFRALSLGSIVHETQPNCRCA